MDCSAARKLHSVCWILELMWAYEVCRWRSALKMRRPSCRLWRVYSLYLASNFLERRGRSAQLRGSRVGMTTTPRQAAEATSAPAELFHTESIPFETCSTSSSRTMVSASLKAGRRTSSCSRLAEAIHKSEKSGVHAKVDWTKAELAEAVLSLQQVVQPLAETVASLQKTVAKQATIIDDLQELASMNTNSETAPDAASKRPSLTKWNDSSDERASNEAASEQQQVGDSLWDAPMVLGASHCGRAGGTFTWILLLANAGERPAAAPKPPPLPVWTRR
jgi:hypothetical protein